MRWKIPQSNFYLKLFGLNPTRGIYSRIISKNCVKLCIFQIKKNTYAMEKSLDYLSSFLKFWELEREAKSEALI